MPRGTRMGRGDWVNKACESLMMDEWGKGRGQREWCLPSIVLEALQLLTMVTNVLRAIGGGICVPWGVTALTGQC